MLNRLGCLERKEMVVVAIVYLTLFASYPYVFSRFFSLPELTFFIVFELFVLSVIFSQLKRTKALPSSLAITCIFQMIIFFLLFLYHSDVFYLTRFILFGILTYFSLFVIHNTLGVSKFVSINNIWIVIQVLLGILGFFLILGNLISPILTYNFDTFGSDYFYGITTTNAFAGEIPRIAGYFDEPGALAQWGVYALVFNRISPQYSKRIERLLMFGLFVTFSMAYYIQFVLYLLLFNFTRIKKFIPIIFLLIGGFFLAQKFIPQNTDLYYLTFRRFEMTNGRLETNRDNALARAKSFYKENPLMGKGYTNLVEKEVYIYDNPYETLATSGILGTIALYLPLVVILLFYRKNGAWQAVAVLSVGYLQRPFHIQYIHYLMMYLLFLMCYYNNKTRKLQLET